MPAKAGIMTWKRSLAIAKKNAKIYYLKPPVLIFGLLFPLFLFLAFSIGRDMEPVKLVPGLLGMTVLFTASSVGPLITPWERQAKTFERLLSSPVSLWHIVFGDVLGGFIYGMFISLIPIIIGILVLGANLAHPVSFIITMLISIFCFACLGSLLSALPTDQPSNVMMLSNLIRLPLLFISGVFLPLEQLPHWGKFVSFISPLTYTMELIRRSFNEEPLLSIPVAYSVLILYTILFLVLARLAQGQGLKKSF